MRHTSGLTYGFTGGSPVQKLAEAADVMNSEPHCRGARRGDRHAAAACISPARPGNTAYPPTCSAASSRVVEGARLGEFLRERVFGPLGMVDTAFFTPPIETRAPRGALLVRLHGRGGRRPGRRDARRRSSNPAAAASCRRSATMRVSSPCSAGGGALDGARILGPRTLAFMASDHLGAEGRQKPLSALARPWLRARLRGAHGSRDRADGRQRRRVFLGRHDRARRSGSRRATRLFAILMVQAPEYREYFRLLFRNLVNAAIV